jgi:ribosomal protein L37AE/L43A
VFVGVVVGEVEMKYLSSAPMYFAYGKGEKRLADPEKCPHPKQVFRGKWGSGTWTCTRCGKEMK